MFWLTLAPLTSNVSKPRWPSTTSLPWPGFQTSVSLQPPGRATSLRSPPVTASSPAPARMTSWAAAIDNVVAATGVGDIGRVTQQTATVVTVGDKRLGVLVSLEFVPVKVAMACSSVMLIGVRRRARAVGLTAAQQTRSEDAVTGRWISTVGTGV